MGLDTKSIAWDFSILISEIKFEWFNSSKTLPLCEREDQRLNARGLLHEDYEPETEPMQTVVPKSIKLQGTVGITFQSIFTAREHSITGGFILSLSAYRRWRQGYPG